MNIFKLIFQSIKLKLYVKIAKRNLQVIRYLDKQKDQLNEVLTNYKVENKVVESRAPAYEYYKSIKAISINDTLKHEIRECDIPKDISDIKVINNPLEIADEGYYCISNAKKEHFAIINGEKHPLQYIEDNIPYTELYEDTKNLSDGYYKKIKVDKRYYHAKNTIITKKINISDIPEDEMLNVKLVKEISDIKDLGYYKIII